MIEKELRTRMIQKHDIEVNWEKAINFIPKKGELIVYDPDENYNYSRVKIGDGISTANELPFIIAVDTTLTQEGKAADAKAVGDAISKLSGGNVDLEGYATEQWVKDQKYLTAVPDGYAKSSEIPKKPEDIGAQPSGNYALKSEIPSVPVQSVNGKTGVVQLSAADVKARPENWMPSAQEVGALPNTYTPPNQTAEQVGADPKGTAATAVSQHNTADDSHNDIRLELKAINDRLTAFFDSDNQTLDELSEIVAYITSNKSLIDSITTSKVSVVDIVNNLTSNVSNKPLSAAQGVVLKGLIDTLSGNLANYQPKGNYLTEETDPTVPSWAKQSTKPSYSKSEVGLGNVDNVKQYSASNPPPYPVTSVNGKTGAVTLDIPGSYTIPSFWQSAVDTAIATIKSLQNGKNCVTFPFFSDNHQRNGYSGVLIRKVMDECHIPFCFYGGDSISSGTIANEAEMIAQDKAFDTMMSVVPNGRLCRAVGNHDGYWYDGTNKYYYNRNQVYELFLREESVAQNKQFGDDGTYFFVEDLASKVRFIVLNSNGGSFDDAQIAWFRDVALNVEEGWAVVVISHQPISNHYHANISNAAAVRAVAVGSGVEIIGWFSGHIHRDRIYTGAAVNATDDSEGADMGFTQVTITSDATNIAYDDATKHAIKEDTLSHAIDFVTINRDTKKVNLTRLGIGNSREYRYGEQIVENEITVSIDPATGEIFNGIGYEDGKYCSGNSLGTESATFATGLIPYVIPETGLPPVIYMKENESYAGNIHCRIQLWNSNKEYVYQLTMGKSSGSTTHTGTYWNEKVVNNIRTLTPIADGDTSKLYTDKGAMAYIRVSHKAPGANCIIRIGTPIE